MGDSGLEPNSLQVRADFEINGLSAGTNLAPQFEQKSQGVWELQLSPPINELRAGKLNVSVRNRQGDRSRIERRFQVGRE